MWFEDSVDRSQAQDAAIGEAGKPAGIVLRLLSDAVPLLLRISIGLAIFYAATIAYGVAVGYALPTATIFLLPHAVLVGRAETTLPLIVLAGSLVAAALGWAAKKGLMQRARLQTNETTCVRLLGRWGLVLLCLVFILELTDSGGWSGRLVANYGSSFSVAGLVPASDANGYFISPIEEALLGHWGTIASQRPFAAGFRQLISAAANYSYTGTLLVQTIMIAVALYMAARAVLLWRGLWPATAFCAFVYLLARPFIATVMTEPLALFWALLSTAFVVDAFRLRSRQYACLGLVTLTIAEMIRLGSLFTIPAFVVWIAITFATELRDRLKLAGAGAGLVAAIIVIQTMFAAAYGDPSTDTGANFAYTLCGLAMGKDWTSCPQAYSQEFHQAAQQHKEAVFLYAKAIQLMSQGTHPMLSRMYHNALDFVTGMPAFILFGFYTYRPLQEWVFLAASLAGLFMAWRQRAEGEVWFWVLLFGSMTASALVIFADAGWRAMHATWPFVALFMSFGFMSPVSSRAAGPPLISPRGASCLIATLVILTAGVPAIARAWPGAELRHIARQTHLGRPDSELIVGRTVTGFVVTPDGTPRPLNVPSISASDFRVLARDLYLERDYGVFVDTAIAHAPIAFVTATRLDRPQDGWNFYLTPTETLTNKAPPAWQFDVIVRLYDRLGRNFVREIKSVRAVR